MVGRIVVGVDGSEGSIAALRWAVDEGRRRGSVVEALLVWLGMSAAGFGDIPYLPDEERRIVAAEHDRLSAAVALALEGTHEAVGGGGEPAGGIGSGPKVTVEPVVVEGDAARVLCERSDKADLLVVGSRRHGGVSRIFHGSVSSNCMHHSRCPVVVVPHPNGHIAGEGKGGG